MNEADLTNIERIVRQGYDLSPTMVRQLVAEVRRLRAFVRKVYDAARLPDYNVLENTTALEWETADLLGLTPDER